MEKKILEILAGIHPQYDYASSVDFLADELLDSFDVIELITFIEESFGVTIDGLDVVPENFRNVEEIKKMIEKSRKNA